MEWTLISHFPRPWISIYISSHDKSFLSSNELYGELLPSEDDEENA